MENKKCPYRSEDILSEAKKCKHCGEWLDDEVKNQELEEELQKDNLRNYMYTTEFGCKISLI